MTASKPESFRIRAPAFGSRTSLLQQALRDEACCNKKQVRKTKKYHDMVVTGSQCHQFIA
jgi:hypothetical protein